MTPVQPDLDLDQAILASLDGLLGALELTPTGDEHFRAEPEPDRFLRTFGGTTVAQALRAAATTVEGTRPHSLHAYFVQAGRSNEPLDVAVEHVRDGRTMSTRRVTVAQGERTLLVALASFHEGPLEPEVSDPPPDVPAPEALPRLQDWLRDLPPALAGHGRSWIDHPPPLELRIGEAPTFLGGPSSDASRSHWMRLPRDVGDDPLLHSVLLAYASDYLLLDMTFRSYPGGITARELASASIDHAIWFHRPVRFDRWHLHTQRTITLGGHRGLVHGAVHDADGHLVATVMQECLLRPAVR